jgi:uncharacterized protein YqhQ
MCLQRLTTAEPDEQQIETAITALTTVISAEEGEKTTDGGTAAPENE